MNILFWNINKKNLINEINSLSEDNDVDVIIIAENEISDTTIMRVLNANRKRLFMLPVSLSNSLNIYVRINRDAVHPLFDSNGIAIREICPPLGLSFIIAAVHLPSKLYADQVDQTFISAQLSEAICDAESRAGHDRTIVIGDFNMNPFEAGMVAANGLHAVMDRPTAMRIKRIVQGKEKKFFYNPMWSRLGDLSKGPPGTYHYPGSGQVCFFWNTFDQVLLRPSLINYFSEEDLKVITNFNGTNLLTNIGKPDKNKFSDHLPILIKLKIEEEV